MTVLNAFNPRSILEYGPGESTKIFHKHESVTLIDSIEHAPGWAEKLNAEELFKMKLYVEAKHYKYPYVIGRLSGYDLIFVDGIERPACISVSRFRLNRTGIIVVHDAERLDYKQAYELWGLKYFVDNGSTAFLTNDIVVGDTLSRILM